MPTAGRVRAQNLELRTLNLEPGTLNLEARKRITIVTAGHVSASPRMLKAADALAGAGYHVRVVSTKSTAWAIQADAAVRESRTWDWTVIDYARVSGRALQVKTGARFRAMQALAGGIGASRVPMSVAIRAYSRMHDEIVRAIVAQPADLIYGGSTGALAAVSESAARLRVPYGIDFEDFHSGEHGGAGGELPNALATRIERHVIRQAAFTTAGSPMIADAYGWLHGVRPLPIHNTFSIVPNEGPAAADEVLRLYWFSQTLGPGRGLEDVIRAAGEAGVAVELHLRATPTAGYVESLHALRSAIAPKLALTIHEASAPDEMVKLAQPYDAGLACEEPSVPNKCLCLSNKIFTYLAAGIPVLLSRTPAQAALERDLADAAFGYECDDTKGLAAIIRRLSADRALRCRARAAASAAAAARWHWEHREDRGALIAAVAAAA